MPCAVWRPARSENQNAPGATRTRNRLIRSQVLYPLSYGGERGHYTACPSIFARRQLFQIVIVVNRPGDVGKQEISPVEDHLHGVMYEYGKDVIPARGVDDGAISHGVHVPILHLVRPAVLVRHLRSGGHAGFKKHPDFVAREVGDHHLAFFLGDGSLKRHRDRAAVVLGAVVNIFEQQAHIQRGGLTVGIRIGVVIGALVGGG